MIKVPLRFLCSGNILEKQCGQYKKQCSCATCILSPALRIIAKVKVGNDSWSDPVCVDLPKQGEVSYNGASLYLFLYRHMHVHGPCARLPKKLLAGILEQCFVQGIGLNLPSYLQTVELKTTLLQCTCLNTSALITGELTH